MRGAEAPGFDRTDGTEYARASSVGAIRRPQK